MAVCLLHIELGEVVLPLNMTKHSVMRTDKCCICLPIGYHSAHCYSHYIGCCCCRGHTRALRSHFSQKHYPELSITGKVMNQQFILGSLPIPVKFTNKGEGGYTAVESLYFNTIQFSTLMTPSGRK